MLIFFLYSKIQIGNATDSHIHNLLPGFNSGYFGGSSFMDGRTSNAIFEFPGRIVDGKCSRCQEDLSFLFPALQEGRINPPKFCPNCSAPLRQDEITQEVWQCSLCCTEIIDPVREKFCRQCRRRIIYPPEALQSGMGG